LPLTDFKIHPGLGSRIKEKGWTDLSNIQKEAFDLIYAGNDAVLEAPTAGGKTEAVFFPLLTREASKGDGAVRILYLAPLRALLNNVELRVEEYSKACGISAFKWHGDVDNKKKWANFNNPSAVLLTTPESLEAIFVGKPGWTKVFKDLSAVIIDEAHNFAAGDRGCHLVCLLERLQAGIGRPFQRIALTATIGNPERMLVWLAGKGRPAGTWIHVDAKSKKGRDFQIRYYDSSSEDENTPPDQCATFRLFSDLRDELPTNRSLIFVRARKDAETYAKAFAEDAKTHKGISPTIRTHHSAVSKFFREQAETLIQFRSQSGIDAIISTSTLELGIDIGALDKVFQLGCTPSPATLLQRVGRTGRRAGKAQYFRGLLRDLDELVVMVGTTNLGLRGKSEALIFPQRAFHILVHQVICLARQSHGISPDKAWGILSYADCFAGITRSEFDSLIAHLLKIEILRDVDGDFVVGEKGEKIFLRSGGRNLFAVFETGPIYEVFEGKNQNQIGFLDSSFVEGLANNVPFYFVLAGILWKARKVDLEHHLVVAERSPVGDPPSWNSFGGLDVPFETAQEIGKLLTGSEKLPYLDTSAAEAFDTERQIWKKSGWKPGAVVLRIGVNGGGDLLTFAGDKINRTFVKLLIAKGILPAGKVAAGYQRLKIKPTKEADAVKQKIADLWKSLSSADGVQISEEVLLSAPSKPFSRLTAQLPVDQLRSMFVDHMTDVDGLIRMAQTRELEIMRGSMSSNE